MYIKIYERKLTRFFDDWGWTISIEDADVLLLLLSLTQTKEFIIGSDNDCIRESLKEMSDTLTIPIKSIMRSVDCLKYHGLLEIKNSSEKEIIVRTKAFDTDESPIEKGRYIYYIPVPDDCYRLYANRCRYVSFIYLYLIHKVDWYGKRKLNYTKFLKHYKIPLKESHFAIDKLVRMGLITVSSKQYVTINGLKEIDCYAEE